MNNKKQDTTAPLRRKWNDEDYKQKVLDREAGLVVDEEDSDKNKKKIRYDLPTDKPLDFFKARDKDLDLKSKVGKSTYVKGVTPADKQGGFYCETCDMHFKDSNGMLDHENSKRHNRLKGVSMRVESSTLSQIQNKLKKAKEDKLAQKSINSGSNNNNTITEKAYEKIYKELEEKEKKEKGDNIKSISTTTVSNNNSNNNNNNNDDKDSSSNNNSNNNNKDNTNSDSNNNNNNNNNNSNKEKEKDKVEYEEDEFDYSSFGLPTNFGSSKK